MLLYQRHYWLQAVVVLCAAACGPTQSAEDLTIVRIRELHRRLELFRNARSVLPASLDSLCVMDLGDCRDESLVLRDGWGQTISYRQSGSEYEIRSPGKDARVSTIDDVILSSARERANVFRLSGCYQVQGSPWNSLDVRVQDSVSFKELRLDTTVSAHVGGGYSVGPAPVFYRSGRSFWHVLDSSSVAVVWTVGLANEQLFLAAKDGVLVGRWTIGDDAKSERATGGIVLKRSTC
jgi:hypothetical protein